MPFSGEHVLDGFDASPRLGWADLDLAEMEPDLPWALLCQRDRYCDGIVGAHRFLDIADHVRIIDLRKTEIAGLQQRGIGFANAVERPDIGLDIAGPIPVPGLELVLFRVEVFLPPGNRRVLEKLEAVVDAIAAGQRSGEGDAGLEHPGLTALQVIGQDIGCVDEEIGPKVFPLRVARELAQIRLQLLLSRAPGKIGVGLGEAELGKCFHQFRACECLRQEDHVRIDCLDLPNQPLPERERFGVWVVHAKDTHPLLDPEQHHVAQGRP